MANKLLAIACLLIILLGVLSIDSTLERERQAKLYADATTPLESPPMVTTGAGMNSVLYYAVPCSTVCTSVVTSATTTTSGNVWGCTAQPTTSTTGTLP